MTNCVAVRAIRADRAKRRTPCSRTIIFRARLRTAPVAGIESLDAERYGAWGYYDKWAASMATVALERGLLSEDELQAALGGDGDGPELASGAVQRFAAGDAVRASPSGARIESNRIVFWFSTRTFRSPRASLAPQVKPDEPGARLSRACLVFFGMS